MHIAQVAQIELGGFMLPRVQRLLSEAPLQMMPPQSAQRSPLGALALKLRPVNADPASRDCQRLVDWLQQAAWVEQLALRPPNVYVRPDATVAGEWVQAGMAERWRNLRVCLPEDASCGAELDVRHPSLQQLRHDVVAIAWQRLCRALGQPDRPTPAVEGLDVPQGTLRARAGGSVDVQDLLCALQGLEQSSGGTPAQGPAALRFFLLRWPRGQRVLLTDARLAESQRALASLSRDDSGAPDVEPDGPTAARRRGELAAIVDQLDAALLRALEQQDACPLLRHTLQVAEALRDAHAQLAADSGLRQAAHQAIFAGLYLCGLEKLSSQPRAAAHPHPWIPSDPEPMRSTPCPH
ncbi:hypothetical protein H5407_21875 [Mitsuaria sp. WAJ17]|uniref:hypothetical protein n=1 Tax=Mitsuaria sp. WAJ17 TaxID=2761452 RepID=UPI001600D30B|nr:hypothetical protein [Mitsuaria sp. WAJ17]MBB2487892.1 hypothetical protein [Mitsuaria sp. WAJ17]